MKFNPEINLGAIIEMLMFLVVVAGGIARFNTIETKLNIMFDWFQRYVIRSRTGPDSEDITKFHRK